MIQIGDLDSRAMITSSENSQIFIDASAPVGYIDTLNIGFYDGKQLICTQIFTLQIGTPDTVFSDDAESGLDNWLTEYQWGTVEDAHDGIYAFTDSPSGEYDFGHVSSLTLAKSLNLSSVKDAYIEFWTKYELEPGIFNLPGDFAQVEVQKHPDSTWKSIEGQYTVLGTGEGVQPFEVPGFAKTLTSWGKEKMKLTEFVGNSDVKVRFKLSADYVYYNDYGDGWYIDDIIICAYMDSETGIDDEDKTPLLFSLNQNYPNPFNPSTTISYSLPQSDKVLLKIYDVKGREVATLVNRYQNTGNYSIKFNTGTLASGIYLYKLQQGNHIQTRKMAILK